MEGQFNIGDLVRVKSLDEMKRTVVDLSVIVEYLQVRSKRYPHDLEFVVHEVLKSGAVRKEGIGFGINPKLVKLVVRPTIDTEIIKPLFEIIPALHSHINALHKDSVLKIYTDGSWDIVSENKTDRIAGGDSIDDLFEFLRLNNEGKWKT